MTFLVLVHKGWLSGIARSICSASSRNWPKSRPRSVAPVAISCSKIASIVVPRRNYIRFIHEGFQLHGIARWRRVLSGACPPVKRLKVQTSDKFPDVRLHHLKATGKYLFCFISFSFYWRLIVCNALFEVWIGRSFNSIRMFCTCPVI